MIKPLVLPGQCNAIRIIVTAIMILLPMIGCLAKPITNKMLLESLKPGEPWHRGVFTSTKTVLFNQTASGGTDATIIAKTQLGFFTSTNCSGTLSGTGFYKTPDGTSFNISVGTSFGLTAEATWNVGTTQLGMSSGTMATIQSIAITFRSTNNNTPQSNFSGSSFSCIEGVSCSSGECTSSSATQNFTLKTTSFIGDPADGGVIACMNGGINNLVASTTDNSTGIIWGGFGTTTNATSTTDGAANTSTIVTALGSTSNAAGTCSTYAATGGYTSGWFLPAGDNTGVSGQLNCLYTNQTAIGGFITALYWSSTESSADNAWYQGFSGGAIGNDSKFNSYRVRCVRALTL